MRQIYTFTNLAGRRVAGHSNTGVGTTVGLDDRDPLTIAAVEAGELVPYGDWATGADAPEAADAPDQSDVDLAAAKEAEKAAKAAAKAAAKEAAKAAKEGGDAGQAIPAAPEGAAPAGGAENEQGGGADA